MRLGLDVEVEDGALTPVEHEENLIVASIARAFDLGDALLKGVDLLVVTQRQILGELLEPVRQDIHGEVVALVALVVGR